MKCQSVAGVSCEAAAMREVAEVAHLERKSSAGEMKMINEVERRSYFAEAATNSGAVVMIVIMAGSSSC